MARTNMEILRLDFYGLIMESESNREMALALALALAPAPAGDIYKLQVTSKKKKS